MKRLFELDLELNNLDKEREELCSEFHAKRKRMMVRRSELLRERAKAKSMNCVHYGMQYKPTKQERIEAIERELAVLKSEL